MIKVIIADDHPIVRKGIKEILEETNEIEVVDEASNGEELLKIIPNKDYDVILLDISMPGRSGIDILKQLKTDNPDKPVLILSIHPEEQYAIRALKNGASGYLTKESDPEEMIKAIQRVHSGGKYISISLAEKLAEEISKVQEKTAHEKLSDREFQVMCMIAAGKSVTEIGNQLFLSVKTVSTYKSRVLEKMNLNNNADIVRYALEHNLI